MRLYRCVYKVNGCYGDFEFWSKYRANSRNNKKDAEAYIKLHFSKSVNNVIYNIYKV